MLGVSQTTISKWESGAWLPSHAMALRLADAIYSPHVGRLKIERACIAPQQQLRALLRGERLELTGISAGFDAYWPEMHGLLGANTRDMLTEDVARYIESTDYIAQAVAGEVLMLTGVSHRLLSFGPPQPPETRLRWHAIARRIDGELIHEMNYEPCAPNTAMGIEKLLRRSDIVFDFE